MEEAALRLRIDPSGATSGALGFNMASGNIVGSARRATMAVTGFTVIATKAFVSFEKQMANVSTMLDEQSMRYMPQYGRAMKRMAIDFGEGTATLSSGLYNVLSASIAADKALGVLEASVKAATAGLTDAGTSTYAITGILNAYGYAADRANRVSDVLFSTVKKGQTTFAQLAPVIGRVTSIAAPAGIALEEISAALSTITRGGISTDEAVTGLRQAIIALEGQQESAVKLAKLHGIELSVQAVQAKGLTGILQELSQLSEPVIASIFKEVRARTALSVLLKDQTGYVTDYQAALNSAGRTQEAYGKMTDTLGHRISRVKELWRVAMQDMGEQFSDELKKMTDAMLASESGWRSFWKTQGEGIAEILSGFEGLRTVMKMTYEEQKRMPLTSPPVTGILSVTPPGMAYNYLVLQRQQALLDSKKIKEIQDASPTGNTWGTWRPGGGMEEGKLNITPYGMGRVAQERAAWRETQETNAWIYEKTRRDFQSEKGAEKIQTDAQEIIDQEDDIAYQRAEIIARMYDDMGRSGKGYYDTQRALLDEQYKQHAKIINDEVTLNEWYEAQVNKLAIESSGFWTETRNALQESQSALSDYMMDFQDFGGLIEDIGMSFKGMFANLASKSIMSGLVSGLFGSSMAGAMGFSSPFSGGSPQMGGILGALLKSGSGNVFSRGQLVPMASGAVLDRPTYFPIANNRMGVAGEAGPELGFIPLRRFNGRLGLDTQGQQPINITVSPPKIIQVTNMEEASLEALRSDQGRSIILSTVMNENE